MAVLYCIGVGAMGAALLVRLWTTATPRAGQGLLEFGFMVVSTTRFGITICSFFSPRINSAFGRRLCRAGQHGVSPEYDSG
jgi:hypothetical protein